MDAYTLIKKIEYACIQDNEINENIKKRKDM